MTTAPCRSNPTAVSQVVIPGPGPTRSLAVTRSGRARSSRKRPPPPPAAGAAVPAGPVSLSHGHGDGGRCPAGRGRRGRAARLIAASYRDIVMFGPTPVTQVQSCSIPGPGGPGRRPASHWDSGLRVRRRTADAARVPMPVTRKSELPGARRRPGQLITSAETQAARPGRRPRWARRGPLSAAAVSGHWHSGWHSDGLSLGARACPSHESRRPGHRRRPGRSPAAATDGGPAGPAGLRLSRLQVTP